MGRKQLVQFIAETLGQTVDPAMLQDIEQEDKMQVCMEARAGPAGRASRAGPGLAVADATFCVCWRVGG